jgi:aryl-alcohol dehydrogenase-like predicted oxidoreductase
VKPVALMQPAPAEVPSAGSARLGSSGLVVSRIGLGLASLGRPAYMAWGRDIDLGADRSIRAMRRRCHALLDVARAAGVSYVDTARSYGLAEQFLSAWCDDRRLPYGAVTIGSKWGYVYTGSWQCDAPIHEVKRLTLDTLRRQSVESRVILGPRLALYQIHSATLESGVLQDRAVLGELARLRGKGLRIGLTVTGPRQADTIRRAIETRIDGVTLFQTVQATWNLLEPSAGEALAEAKAAGYGVIVKEVLANGRLTDRYGGPALEPLRAHARALATSVETLATAAALAQPWADVVLSGAVTAEQLEAHVAALFISAGLGPFETFAEPADTYWRKRMAMLWT